MSVMRATEKSWTARASSGAASLTSAADRYPPVTAAGKFYYKAVARVGTKLMSIYDGVTEYKLNCSMKHPETSHVPYGYFFYATVDEALQAGFPTSSALYVAPRAILKCMAWGEIPVPSTGNHAKSLVFTQVRPVEVLDVPLGAKNVQFSRRELTGIKLACARQIFPPFTAATGRNSMPLHRSSADERALSHNVVLMEEEMRHLVRMDLGGRSRVTPGFDRLITQAQVTGMKRFLRSKGVNVEALLEEERQGVISARNIRQQQLRRRQQQQQQQQQLQQHQLSGGRPEPMRASGSHDEDEHTTLGADDYSVGTGDDEDGTVNEDQYADDEIPS